MSSIEPWGRYPKVVQTAYYANWQSEVKQICEKIEGSTLAFGNGRSYGDSCLAHSGQVVCTRTLDRCISADWDHGVVRAEAGLLLSEILDLSVERGWFLPVTPGTKFVTLGGAVANDVHGKNHHVAGTFGCHVRCFSIYRSDIGVVECSLQENRELFVATIGGLGLTGIILWVELQLKPIDSSLIDSCNIKFGNLDEFFALSTEYDDKYEYTVAWVDCLASNDNLGRGIYMVGNHATEGPLELPAKRKVRVPVDLPFSLVNQWSLRLFNMLYYGKQRSKEQKGRVGYEPFFYPLDTILEWNKIYGKPGFQQYQCVLPGESSRDAMKDILRTIARHNMGSFLAVLKKCGEKPSPGLLSFPLKGVSLALDFPQIDRKITPLFQQLDDIVTQAGGRLYPAKDAHMSGEFFRNAYPQWQQLEKMRDPRLLSHFWRRITG